MSGALRTWQAELQEPLPVSTRPMKGGLGRSLRFKAAIEALPLADRRLLLEALDEIMRPMSPREIEEALLRAELPRADRKRLVLALKHLPIVMIAGEPA